MSLSLEEGALLVRMARSAVSSYLATGTKPSVPESLPDRLREKRPVFVTIRKLVTDSEGVRRWALRGCLGYVTPLLPLAEATVNAAIAAATRDPRFSPLTAQELPHVIFEVTVLSELEPVEVEDPRDYPREVRVGVHGLVVEKGLARAVLLPQIAVEYEWDERTFLSQACVKAGLPPDAWELGDLKVYRFTAQIFAEIEPQGEVIERQLYVEEAPGSC
ncbi:MAG: TIGR00296 family protein [Thermoprotei archaeon]|nr:MAG: TIGR00296 family protein [Thermoprotei archaeon]